MTDWHAQPLTTLAFVWRIERGDGVALGFTSHDRDLDLDGFRYASTPGMRPSAIRMSDGFDVDDLDLEGALTSDLLTEADLLAGRWDGARLSLAAVDWQNAGAPLPLLGGTLGGVSLRDGAFTVSLRGPTSVFDRPVAEETSPSCRARLGDKRCRVNLAPLTRTAVVIAIEEARVTLTEPQPDGAFDFGTLRWTDGANAGLTARVLRSAGNVLTLAEAPPLAQALPVAVELVEGCDRQFSTCCDRFANAANFRGEPHLPGNDLLTRYGG